MAKFKKGQSGNPKGRPLAARGLRAALVARYGDDGAVLVERLEERSKLTDRRNAKLALDVTELLLAYHSGKPTPALLQVIHSCLEHPGIQWLICRWTQDATGAQLKARFREVCPPHALGGRTAHCADQEADEAACGVASPRLLSRARVLDGVVGWA